MIIKDFQEIGRKYQMQDRCISINYSVYQTEAKMCRLVGKYSCKCVANDVVEYLKGLGIKSYIIPKIKEEVY